MGMRPKVHREEVAAAVQRIASRRSKVDDPDRDRLPDGEDIDPRDVLVYLRRFSGSNIPRWVLQADIGDAMILLNWLWWQDRDLELYFLRAGRARGLFLSQLAAMAGVGKQGILDRIDRLQALLKYNRPDEKLAREDRRAKHQAQQRRPAELGWIAEHLDELAEAMAELLQQAQRYASEDADWEWVDHLAEDVADREITPATMAILGLVCAEVRAAPGVLALDSSRPHAVHTVLARCDALRSDYSALGTAELRRSRRRTI